MDTTVGGPAAQTIGSERPVTGRESSLPSLGAARLVDVPQGLARLTRQIVLNGRIEAVDADGGTARLTTAAGRMTLTVPADVQAGDALVLRIDPGVPPVRADLFRAAPAPGTETGRAGAPGQAAAAAAEGAAEGAAATGEAEAAFLARLPQVTAPVPPETGLQPGTVFSAWPVSGAGAGATGGASGAAPDRVRLVAAALPGRTAALTGPGQSLAERAAVFGVRLWQGTVIEDPASGNARVAGRPGGALRVRTADGVHRLDLAVHPPAGTVLTALVLERAEPDANAKGGRTPNLVPVRNALMAVSSLDAPTARELLETVVPQPNGRLAASLAFTLGQFQAGDARGWLGEVAATLLERHGHADLLAELGEDFRDRARVWAETPAEQWRSAAFPVFDGSVLGAAHLHVKSLPADQAPARARAAAPGQRFLIDLEMSRLGRLQLDGLVKGRRFNLLVRSHEPLPEPLRVELQQSFAAALCVTNYAGGLAFRVGTRDFVETETEERRPAGLGVVV